MIPRTKFALALVTAALAATAFAQQPGATPAGPSSPASRRPAIVAAADLEVMAIDKATRTLTLKGPKGDSVDIVAGDEVKNFDQIKLGDLPRRALRPGVRRFETRKTRVAAGELDGARGSRQGQGRRTAGGRRRADNHCACHVTAVDPDNSTIAPRGRGAMS